MLARLKAYFRRQQFQPGVGALFVNPFYFARKDLYRHISALAGNFHGKVLDIGCGQKPYQQVFHNVDRYLGLERDTETNRRTNKADYYYQGDHLPFADGEFDGVFCSQVLEHVFNPDQFMAEIARVLKTDGMLLLTVPFVWDEHEQPFDYARYSSFGLLHQVHKSGFNIIENHKTLADIRVLFQLLNAYLYKVLASRNKYLNLLLAVLLMAPVNLLGLLLYRLLPANPDLYLDNIILAKKTPSDV